jgi:hypothetical protein
MGAVDYLDELVRGWLATYDHLFKVPIVGRPSFDGTRDVGGQFQREIDEEVDRLIARFGIVPRPLGPNRRANWVRDILKIVVPSLGIHQESLFYPKEETGLQ